jgi:formate/nitrite transporter FocA (FNT family)
MLIHWVVTCFGNLAGSLFIVAIITGYGGVFDPAGYKKEAVTFATTKQVTPAWHMIFLRAIAANWLVCLACYLGMSGREFFSKIVGIWWPTFAFVSLGMDHVVANSTLLDAEIPQSLIWSVFFVPMGIWQGAPDISVGLYIWKGIIPAGVGNIIGGAVFVGAYYWYQYLLGQELVVIDGVPYGGASIGSLDLGRRKKVDVENSPPATLQGEQLED